MPTDAPATTAHGPYFCANAVMRTSLARSASRRTLGDSCDDLCRGSRLRPLPTGARPETRVVRITAPHRFRTQRTGGVVHLRIAARRVDVLEHEAVHEAACSPAGECTREVRAVE